MVAPDEITFNYLKGRRVYHHEPTTSHYRNGMRICSCGCGGGVYLWQLWCHDHVQTDHESYVEYSDIYDVRRSHCFAGRPLCPKGKEWDKAVEYWKSLRTDKGAK